jgi:hypothetical protein
MRRESIAFAAHPEHVAHVVVDDRVGLRAQWPESRDLERVVERVRTRSPDR